jgi:2-oxoglutarate dehydrogenase E1 component
MTKRPPRRALGGLILYASREMRDLLELAGSLGFIDEMYAATADSPAEVDPSWLPLFGAEAAPLPSGNGASNGRAAASSSVVNGNGNGASNGHGGHAVSAALLGAAPMPILDRPGRTTLAPAQANPGVWPLVNAFRSRGHFAAKLDPLGLVDAVDVAELEPSTWGFSAADANRMIEPTGVHGLPRATLAQLQTRLAQVYCGSVGLEFMHISAPAKRSWLAERCESGSWTSSDATERKDILENLIGAESFERFCHVKYPGTKRFSLEGSESLIPLLSLILSHGCRLGAAEAVLGMAHRGRLTTLEYIMRRAAREIFAEFQDVEPEASMGGGDVKYHLGYSTDRIDAEGRSMHVTMSFNPSHLEAIDPVVVGRVRAKQERRGDVEHRQVVGVLVHGDSAFAGQGLVPETLNLCSLPGYRTGGTVHVIVNNQVGFTANPSDARSTPYCTDVAKMIECPIWHVNGEDLEAVAAVVAMAMAYRAEFASDVIIDMYCYRKYGHNEMDEPSFTQPVMYERIQRKESIVEMYARRLVEDGTMTRAEIEEVVARRAAALEVEHQAAKTATARPVPLALAGLWRGYSGGRAAQPIDADTRVPIARLGEIAAALASVPEGFNAHPKVLRQLELRAQMGKGERPLDWGMAELLAYGSLVADGANVRLSGQDSARGTFSHRHAAVTDVNTGAEYTALVTVAGDVGKFRIYDSPLSEAGVLGFEFGYSLDSPDALVMWEAQFGDFVNGAQVILDQFLVASEDKWRRLSGLVLLLPHGYEGQGPEHSSARLERFLESCAEHNIQVAQPTTPAQMFHLLRLQMLRTWRKPLVVMTPKSLLRLPAASSTLEELANGSFQRVIPDGAADPAQVTRVLFCSGKIYFELVEERKKRNDPTVAIVRIEKLYPWWDEVVDRSIDKYAKLADIYWVQDEPANMGAGTFVTPRLGALASLHNARFRMISRVESASPATGSHKAHVLEQNQILKAAFEK